jgi:hypothetical protein
MAPTIYEETPHLRFSGANRIGTTSPYHESYLFAVHSFRTAKSGS